LLLRIRRSADFVFGIILNSFFVFQRADEISQMRPNVNAETFSFWVAVHFIFSQLISVLISTRLQPGVGERDEGERFQPFFARSPRSTLAKPLKRLGLLGALTTGLKPGVNETARN
jgi:hypothetical protein